jgi:hypothetical protein
MRRDAAKDRGKQLAVVSSIETRSHVLSATASHLAASRRISLELSNRFGKGSRIARLRE